MTRKKTHEDFDLLDIKERHLLKEVSIRNVQRNIYEWVMELHYYEHPYPRPGQPDPGRGHFTRTVRTKRNHFPFGFIHYKAEILYAVWVLHPEIPEDAEKLKNIASKVQAVDKSPNSYTRAIKYRDGRVEKKNVTFVLPPFITDLPDLTPRDIGVRKPRVRAAK